MIWKNIPSIPGAKANDKGQIMFPEKTATMPNGGTRSYKTKPIFGSRRRSKKGAAHSYFGVLYRGKNYKIHRLVCEAFHGPPPFSKAVVIHIDENGLNNKPDNLKWGTQKENMNSAGFIEYCRSRTGDKNPYKKGLQAKKAKQRDKTSGGNQHGQNKSINF